jgi:glycosidase
MDKSAQHPSGDWQRNLVLTARNTPVWLYQLSQKYSQEIRTLDQIPEEEIAVLAERGFNSLWLVGLWQRSPASRKIKHLYGHSDAIASAYSIYAYRPADNLGGKKSLVELRRKANAHGIYLACDMVPNHTGLDAPWVYSHPDRYIRVPKSPMPNFSFNSPDLSDDPAGAIYLEEGYYNQTGAAEVFKYVPQGGSETFIYHGNDGTSMPWNDTAQLNYLNPETRQAVLQEILQVAQEFHIIRLDAAMTLVREHFKRLWFPSPAGEKYIPTRGANVMSDEEFDRLMPREFWSEVIQAIRREAPQTVLIAEAFWLMEKFFINEIGMHRVYNSAFMHQLRDEDNAKFRSYLKEILQSSPAILERFVNFLTTPDEEPAVLQFGREQKYLGACRLLACMPGLPLFGHGQWEGLSEHYGMDIARPTQLENVDQELVALHNRHIQPLLRQRSRFSSAENFYLYDFSDKNGINESVIVFSTSDGENSSLVVFNNAPHSAKGWVMYSVPQLLVQKEGIIESRPIWDVLQGKDTKTAQLTLTDFTQSDRLAFSFDEVKEKGLALNLHPYESHVFSVAWK